MTRIAMIGAGSVEFCQRLEMQWLPQFQGKKPTSRGSTIGRLETGAKTMKVGADVYTKLFAEPDYW